MMTEEQAVQELQSLVDSDTDPKLTDDELKSCLRTHQRAKLWTAETLFFTGDRVISPATGRLYKCVYGGTSGTEAPFTRYGCHGHYSSAAIGDGEAGGLYWQDSGEAPREIYDVRAAAGEAWTRKAGKCASFFNTQDKDVKNNYEALQANCLRMALQYRPVFAA